MVLGGQSREVIMLTDDNDHLPQPAASGHQLTVAVTSEFLTAGGTEWPVLGDQVDHGDFRTRPSRVIHDFSPMLPLMQGCDPKAVVEFGVLKSENCRSLPDTRSISS